MTSELPRRDAADSPTAPIASVIRDLGGDAGFRRDVAADPRGVLAARGVDVPPGVELRVAANADDTFHFVMPPDPNEALADDALSGVSGGRAASTASSLGTVGTASCIPSCWGTVGSAGSVATVAE